jgi:hypothetical protein
MALIARVTQEVEVGRLCTADPGDTPVAATGVTSKTMLRFPSASTSVYVLAVAPVMATPLRSQRKVEVPSVWPTMLDHV